MSLERQRERNGEERGSRVGDSLKGKNVLVTGGAGFIGSNLVDRLIAEQPRSVVVVDNFFLGSEENLRAARLAFPDLVVHRLDASNLPAMEHVVKKEKTDVVFNLAVIPLPTSSSSRHGPSIQTCSSP